MNQSDVTTGKGVVSAVADTTAPLLAELATVG
jgi:hypothetical protein